MAKTHSQEDIMEFIRSKMSERRIFIKLEKPEHRIPSPRKILAMVEESIRSKKSEGRLFFRFHKDCPAPTTVTFKVLKVRTGKFPLKVKLAGACGFTSPVG